MSGISIKADTVVQPQLEARGITKNTGVFGEHKVQLGKEAPIRLDSIKSNSIPFQGFRTATKIERGRAGLEHAVQDTLAVLGKSGKIGAKALLSSLKTCFEYTDRMEKLGQMTAQEKGDYLRMFAPAVENLSNTELTAIYQMFGSAEMDLLQTALMREGQVNPKASDARKIASCLFDLQALVLKEVSNRVGRSAIDSEAAKHPEQAQMLNAMRPGSLSEQYGAVPPMSAPEHSQDISSANMLTLVEVAAESATTREKSAAAETAKMQRRNMPSIEPKIIGDMLRSSEITINIHTRRLLAENVFLMNPDAPMENIFHLADRGVMPKGPDYLKVRDSTEHLLFPELPDQDPNADERPLYGALNTLHLSTGAAARDYGRTAIVLKPEVARRATFMANDTFYSPRVSVTPERREAFYALLDGAVSPQLAAEYRDVNSPRHAALEKFLDALARTEGANVGIFQNLDLKMVPDDEYHKLVALLIDCFGDKAATRKQMASFDNLESLLPGLDELNGAMLGKAAQEFANGEKGLFRLSKNYIEAQIQGPLIPSRDIAEIRIDLASFSNENDQAIVRQRALDFQARTGVKVTFLDSGAASRDENVFMATMDKGLAFSAAHLDPALVAEEQDRIAADPQKALKALCNTNPELHKAFKNLDEVLRGPALQRCMEKFNKALKSTTPTREEYEADAFVSSVFKKTVTPILKQKAEMIRELENLPFETEAQKAAFSTWIRSAGNLRSVEEMRIIHTHATHQAMILREIAQAEPPLEPGAIFRKMDILMTGVRNSLNAFFAKFPSGEIGKDDKDNELGRIASMAYSLLEAGNPPMNQEQLAAMTNRIDSPAMRTQLSMLLQLQQSSGMENNKDYPLLDSLVNMTWISASTFRRKLGERYDLPRQVLDPSFLSHSMRETLKDAAPEVSKLINARYPEKTLFPAAAIPGRMPATEAGRKEFLLSVLDNYMNHEKTFEKGRSTHGRGHIARAYIFASALSSILEEQGVVVDRNAVLCGIAGHDLGRRGGGYDAWEKDSANLTVDNMRRQFGEDAMGKEYEDGVTAAITDHRGQTVEGMLLHAADSLDIGRVKDFDEKHFAFLRALEGEKPSVDAQNIRKQLAVEADLLQRISNPLCQYRSTFQHYDERIAASTPPLQDLLMEDKMHLTDEIAAAFAKEWEMDSAAFMHKMESIIQDNRDMFPLLSQYYHG